MQTFLYTFQTVFDLKFLFFTHVEHVEAFNLKISSKLPFLPQKELFLSLKLSLSCWSEKTIPVTLQSSLLAMNMYVPL